VVLHPKSGFHQKNDMSPYRWFRVKGIQLIRANEQVSSVETAGDLSLLVPGFLRADRP
jgi:hypothetical protein